MVPTKQVICLAVMDNGYHSVHEKPAIIYNLTCEELHALHQEEEINFNLASQNMPKAH